MSNVKKFASENLVVYKKSDESIKSIEKGLNLGLSDNLLAPLKSGDLVFRLLEKGISSTFVTKDEFQIDYFNLRLEALKKGDIDSFLVNIPCVNTLQINNKQLRKVIYKRDEYVSRFDFDKILKNLDKLNIVKGISLFDNSLDISEYNKIYLSNEIEKECKNPCLRNLCFQNFSKRFKIGTIFYLSKTKKDPGHLNSDYSLNGLFISRNLTRKAKNYEKFWKPVVYLKKEVKF